MLAVPGSRPIASTEQTEANLVTVGGSNRSVVFYNGSPGSAEIIADVVGYYTDGSTDSTDASGRFVPVAPTRARHPGRHRRCLEPIASRHAFTFTVAGQADVPADAGASR